MKLDEFVKQTLLDITNGVVQAQNEALLFIAPGTVEGEVVKQPQNVKFEVTVSVSKEVGGGIKVFTLGDAKAQGKSESTNKLTFEVPVYFNAPTPRNPKHFSKKSVSLRDSEVRK
ncbi:hypothetical protein ACFFP0_02780 [Rhizobium puerariae]|uniref:Sporulation protein n=1 Tax=Rhizobium puerariae TaxID=1585791 RepID=A0ABV6AD19_9HYPH